MRKRHEQLLFRYSSALESGDFETVAEILRDAERDPELEAMILELNEIYAAEPREETNHRNPKELVMIAPLYQKRTAERMRPYTLPMIAALALVALVGVLLATRIAPSTQWNTGQDGSPEAIVMQIDPTECAEGVPFALKLYSRPAADAVVTNEYFSSIYISQANIRQTDAAEADGESWYFVTINTSYQDIQGWIRAEEYNRNVRCAPLINPTVIAQVTESAVLTGTPTSTPFDEALLMSATALVAQASALPPTVVPPDMLPTSTPLPVGGNEPTVVPPDMLLPTFTATPAPFDGSQPTVVPGDVQGLATLTLTPALFDGSVPTLVQPAEIASVPVYPIYTVQAGDTLLSILSQFNLSAAWLDELLFINNLPDDASELPRLLLIPVPTQMQLMTCMVDAEVNVTVREQPAADAAVSMELPGGSAFRVINQREQAGETWYMVAVQSGNSTVRGAWVDAEAVSTRSDCRHFAPLAEPNYALPSFDPANYPFGIVDCFVVTENAINSYFPAALDAELVTELPAGTQLQIVTPVVNAEGVWFMATYYEHVNPVGARQSGYVRADEIVLPPSCDAERAVAAAAEATIVPTPEPETIGLPIREETFIQSLPPTAVPPAEVAAVPTVLPPSIPEEYPVYTVQEGDTLLSILAQFNLDANMLPELLFINNLSVDAADLPETLLIPVKTGERWLTCLVDGGETIVLRQQPSADAREIATLREGSVFRVFNNLEQADRQWYTVVAQFGSVIIRSAWMNAEALSLNADCQRFFPVAENLSPGQSVATPTPVDPLAVAANFPQGYGCTIETQNVVNIHDEPSNAAPVREQLPAGTSITIVLITQQAEGDWYVVNYRTSLGETTFGLVAANMLDVPEDCPYYHAENGLIPAASLPTATPTPVS